MIKKSFMKEITLKEWPKFWFGGNREEVPVEGNNISKGTGMQKCTVCCETSEYPFGLDWNGDVRESGNHWRGRRMHCHSKGSLFYTERGIRNGWNGCFLGITSCSMTKGSNVVTITDYEPFSNLNEVWERGLMYHYGGLKAGCEYESTVLFWVQFLKEIILYID